MSYKCTGAFVRCAVRQFAAWSPRVVVCVSRPALLTTRQLMGTYTRVSDWCMLLQAPWEAFEPQVRSGEEFVISGMRRAGDASGTALRMVFRCAHGTGQAGSGIFRVLGVYGVEDLKP